MLKTLKNKVVQKALIFSEAVMMGFTSVTAHANGPIDTSKVNIIQPGNNLNVLGNVIGVALGIFQFVGLGMLILGVAQFVMATHDDQPDKKIKALTLAGCGAVLTALRFVLKAMGLIG